MKPFTALLFASLLGLSSATLTAQEGPVVFNVRSTRSGKWSDARIWADRRAPKAGDNVQIRAEDVVTYDVNSDQALRVVHVAGTLRFARDKSTRLDVGLLRIEPGNEISEDGFNCHDTAVPAATMAVSNSKAVLEIGTTEEPIPAKFTATIRLTPFEGMNPKTLPAIVNCGGRWDVHGAPMNRTWVKLAAPAKRGDNRVVLLEPVTGWRVGDRVIVTASKLHEVTSTYRQGAKKHQPVQTEERLIVAQEGTTITLDQPLEYEHFGEIGRAHV